MKRIILGSIVAAALLFSGCGNDSKKKDTNTSQETNETNETNNTSIDTVGPVFTNTTGIINMFVDENKTISATDATGPVDFNLTDDANGTFDMNGSLLIGSSQTTEANITIVATDSSPAKNQTIETFLVKVTQRQSAFTGGATINSLNWTALLPKDNNATLSGRKLYTDAAAVCSNRAGSWSLPTVGQLSATVSLDTNDVNTSSLKEDGNGFNYSTVLTAAGTPSLLIWTSTSQVPFLLNSTGEVANSNPVRLLDDEAKSAVDANVSNYYTCVETAN